MSSADAPTAGDASLQLQGQPDLYGGVIVDEGSLPSDPKQFELALLNSLEEWRRQGKRGIWLKLPLALASHVAPAANPGGFTFHHAEEGYVMMTRWLPTELSSSLPPNASHQVGVGAFVLDAAGRVLAVQEASGPLQGSGVWKMPTGLVQQGEDLVEAAEREVLEETGVRARFRALLAVRQAHGFAFGKSDLFFCCALQAEPEQEQLQRCEREIADVAWLPLADYVAAQTAFGRGVELYATLLDTCVAYAEGRYRGMQGRVLDAGVRQPRHDLLLWGEGAGVQPADAGATSSRNGVS